MRTTGPRTPPTLYGSAFTYFGKAGQAFRRGLWGPQLRRSRNPSLGVPEALLAVLAGAFATSTAACGGADAGSPSRASQGDAGAATDGPVVTDGPVRDSPVTDARVVDAPVADGSVPEQVEAGAEAAAAAEAGEPWMALAIAACTPDIYTVPVLIGAQTFQLGIDTGSTTLGVASTSCTNCGVTPEYTPGSTATDENEMANAQYGMGSWTGQIYQDTVVAGGEGPVPVKLVAIDTQSQFFTPIECDSKSSMNQQGILGLGPAAAAERGTNGYFDDLVKTANIPNVFATQLCDSGGTLWLGGYDPSATTAAPVYTPMNSELANYYYAVNLVSITVDGTSVPVGTTSLPDSIADTGTSVFILPTAAFTSLSNAIAADSGFQSVFGQSAATFFSAQDNCLVINKTKAELDSMLPPLTLVFGSNPAVSVQAAPTESYLIQYDTQWCSALLGEEAGSLGPIAAIMGSPVLRSNVVIFDRANKRIGFAPHAPCN